MYTLYEPSLAALQTAKRRPDGKHAAAESYLTHVFSHVLKYLREEFLLMSTVTSTSHGYHRYNMLMAG